MRKQPTIAKNASELKQLTLAAMERNNVVLGVVSGAPEQVLAWTLGTQRFLAGIRIRFRHSGHLSTSLNPDDVSLPELRDLFTSGKAHILGEVGAQYDGIPIDDPALDPLFGLAHELDVPVHVHVLGGGGTPDFPSHLGNPLRLVPVLRKFPGLRLHVENSAWPFLEEITALMYQYPSVYGDVSTILTVLPREVALNYLRRLVEKGLGKRIMFGSDQGFWPERIDLAVDLIQSAKFLTAEQKADIFYNNAARFLRIGNEEISEHRGR